MPIKSTFPSPGSVGGVSGRSNRVTERSNPFSGTRIATVEGILVFGMAIPFAGYRWNAGLGRSDASLGFLPSDDRAGDSGCPEGSQGGERRQHTLSRVRDRSTSSRWSLIQVTRPSLGPPARARNSSQHSRV